MKYIKKFEKYSQKMYWLIPTDKRFKKSLKQLNFSIEKIKGFSNSKEIKKHNYIFVGYNPNLNSNNNNIDDYNWGWNRYRGKPTEDYYEDNNYKFMGNINIDESEFAANKFNL